MLKTVVVISDVHCGHKLAVSPLSFKDSEGGVYHANKVQRALYGAWLRTVKDWKNPDILVVNGEPIDGQQPKDKGVEAWTTDYLTQVDAAVSLVKMFGSKKIYVTRGSNYHVEQGGVSIEEIFGQRIGAQKVDGGYVEPELFLKVNSTTINFAHHIAGSVSGWMYRSTPAAKEMMLATLNQSHKWPFDILVRSHNHYFWAVQSTTKMAVLTPAWQMQSWFAYKRTAAGSIPDIGAIRFVIVDGDYRLEKKIFKLAETRPPLVQI